ncbi:hypothetical protein DIPPA_07973 [Diplonema papillatum]|nr:hypothetical protein DIPPA_07973 [Diplonema papillatum]
MSSSSSDDDEPAPRRQAPQELPGALPQQKGSGDTASARKKAAQPTFDEWASATARRAAANSRRGVFGKPIYCTRGYRVLQQAYGAGFAAHLAELTPLRAVLSYVPAKRAFCEMVPKLDPVVICAVKDAGEEQAADAGGAVPNFEYHPNPMAGAAASAELLLALKTPQPPRLVRGGSRSLRTPRSPRGDPAKPAGGRRACGGVYAPPSARCAACGDYLFSGRVCAATELPHFSSRGERIRSFNVGTPYKDLGHPGLATVTASKPVRSVPCRMTHPAGSRRGSCAAGCAASRLAVPVGGPGEAGRGPPRVRRGLRAAVGRCAACGDYLFSGRVCAATELPHFSSRGERIRSFNVGTPYKPPRLLRGGLRSLRTPRGLPSPRGDPAKPAGGRRACGGVYAPPSARCAACGDYLFSGRVCAATELPHFSSRGERIRSFNVGTPYKV